jgi:glycosyltransferase involved in cell wall biosynthesis
MRIAYIVPYVPNQIRTRSYNLITSLTKLGHDVDVFTVGTNQADRQDAEALSARCANVVFYDQPLWRSLTNSLGATFSGNPLQSVYSLQPDLVNYLTELFSKNGGSRYDAVHVEHLRGSQYGVSIKSRLPAQPIVWDSVDCISHLFEQASTQSTDFFGKLVTRFELGRTRKMEGRLLSYFDHILVTSPTDKTALLRLAGNDAEPAPISVLSNGVDQDFFYPNPEVDREPETLIFSGKMSYHANRSMVRYLVTEIMPRIWRMRPSTHLYIVGKDPSKDVKELNKNPLITVTGTVDDIRPFLWRATVAVVPLVYGAGIQNKILEAMATGTPVVATSKAVSALDVQVGEEIIVGDSSDEFSKAVLRLLDSQSLQQNIGAAGASYIKKHHSWLPIASQLADIYQRTIKDYGELY